jgi:hypothetical protein
MGVLRRVRGGRSGSLTDPTMPDEAVAQPAAAGVDVVAA